MITSIQNSATKGKLLAIAVLLAAIASLMLAAEPSYASTTFYVNSTADHADANLADGFCDTNNTVPGAGGEPEAECTLRAALNQANYTSGADTIYFAIPGTNVKTIAPESALPKITEAVIIDGYTQPGARPNAKAVGDDAALRVELSGASAPDVPGLWITAANSTVKGLVVNGWTQGIRIDGSGATGIKVVGNFIGTDASGTRKLGNAGSGVFIYDAPNNTVGGTTAAERNLISGNTYEGVTISGPNATGNKVAGNYLGTDRSGTADLGNGDSGVYINAAPNNTIGGTTTAARNVVSGNGFGVYIEGAGAIDNRVLQNVISGNIDSGVTIYGDGATGNRVLSNSIFSNGGIGIDLDDDGPTANDPGDKDTGPNNLQNKPVLSSAKKSATGTTTVKGTLNSIPNKTFQVQFFSNPEGTDDGKTLLASKSVSTNGTGNVSFTFSTKKTIRLGQNITATATNTSTGDTSEFSGARKVVAL